MRNTLMLKGVGASTIKLKKLRDSGAADKAAIQRVRVSPHQLPSTRSNPAQSRPTDNPVSDRRACIYKGSYVL